MGAPIEGSQMVLRKGGPEVDPKGAPQGGSPFALPILGRKPEYQNRLLFGLQIKFFASI